MSRAGRLLAGWLLAATGIALFASLGQWQLQRMQAKQAMLDASAHVLAQRIARPLATAFDPSRAHGYDWASGHGRFVGAPLLLDNQMRDGQPGVHVYQLFLPSTGTVAGPRRPLLVDLGWVAMAADRALPALQSPPSGEVDLRGLLAPPPAAGLAVGASMVREGRGWLMTRLDPADIGHHLALPRPPAPRVLRLDPALPLGYTRDLRLLANTLTPERHLGYAVQWFALALAVLVTALVLTFRKPKQ